MRHYAFSHDGELFPAITHGNIHLSTELPRRDDFISVLIFRFWLALLFCLCPVQLQLAKAQSSNVNFQADLVTQELHYHAPGASEVYLVCGINGLQAVPDATRPPDSYRIAAEEVWLVWGING